MPETEEKGRAGAGCTITKEDYPRVVSSVACYSAFLVYGACVSSLGAALPSLADATHQSHSSFGVAFTTRGIGYALGTLLSAWILGRKDLTLTKEFMTCAALATTGISTGIIANLKSFVAMLIVFFIQGIGFGGIDVMANCCMPELWGLRVQPWMQALHALFGVGAIIGPAMVGSLEYHTTFVIIAICSFIPISGLILVTMKQELWRLCTGVSQSSQGSTTNTNSDDVEKNSPKLDEEKKTDADDRSSVSSSTATDTPGVPVPILLKALIVGLYFVYVGMESGYAGWVPTFALDTGVTTSYAEAAYLSSYFWAALTIGRILAIVVAIYMSATTMLRVQLCIIIAGAIFIVRLANKSYQLVVGASWFFGFACSSVFPLAMTIVADYGYTMDSATTTMFMLSATLGESIVPVCIGILIQQASPLSLVWVTLVCSVSLCLIYFGMHYIGGIKKPDSSSGSKSSGGGDSAGDNSVENALHKKVEVELSTISSGAQKE